MELKKQSGFSRSLANTMKMGAYYTPAKIAGIIGKMIVCEGPAALLEPSMGDGSAVKAFTASVEGTTPTIFGVELNEGVVKEVRKDPTFEAVLSADFLTGVRISNNVFSIVFGNPPYMTDDLVALGRSEKSFLEKVNTYLAKDGIVVWIVPESTIKNLAFARFWMGHFETEAFYRFPNGEYEDFKQYILIGRKCARKTVGKEDTERWLAGYASVLPLPERPGERIRVPASDPDGVKLFAPKEFPLEEAFAVLTGRCHKGDDFLGEHASQPRYAAGDVGRPPMPLKKDSMYLLSVSGAGQGLAGTEGDDLHLQRGVAKVVEDVEIEASETKKNKSIERVTTRTSITMTVIEGDGKITHLI